MEGFIRQISDDAAEVVISTQSDKETTLSMLALPDPVPSTHRLYVKREGRQIRIGCEPIPLAPGADPADDPHAEAKALAEKTQAELQTIGAELGLTLAKSQSKAHMAALIVEKRRERAAPEPT